MRFSIPGIFGFFVLTLYAGLVARAADPQSYRVDMASTGDGSMDATLRATSELAALRESAPVSPFGLIARARGEVDRLKTVLESYGYYQSAVTITIEGLGLSSTGLAAALTALPKDQSAHVAITFNLGPLYHLRKVDIEGTVPESAQGAFTLTAGAPAVAADVLGAGARLLSALQERGYAFAQVDPPVAYEDQTLPVLDVSFRVDAGARATIGEIKLEGLQRVHEKLVRRRLTLRSGQQYSPTAIEAARRDLLSLGPFAAISVDVGKAVDSTGGVPITFTLRERKRHAVALNAAYSTDLGGSGGVTWSDRNVFGNAEQLVIAASVINLGGSSTNGIGYDTSAKFTIPEFGHRDQSLQIAVGAIKQSLQAYDQNARTSGVALTRKLSSVWTASVGISTTDEQISQPPSSFTASTAVPPSCVDVCNTKYNYTLAALPLSVNYDSTHLASPLDDPTHGMRDSLSVTPTESIGHPNASFIITQIKLAVYFDLHSLGFTDPGRSVLAVRALAGQAQGAAELSLPPDQRFYGGGSGTIRGYAYQSVGPQFCADGSVPAAGKTCPASITSSGAKLPAGSLSGIPIGGTAIAAGTLEFRQRFGANWGSAFFVDGGQVSASLKPLPSEFRIGVGAGARYYTPIGPIRLDVAVPTHRDSISGIFQVYIGLGQAF
ncbi:MAG TPA: BamA/TamA family outer membrane protein [Steroidobacteraceae bacterium]|nr:BamA/TamA family outer membrane protein [Steroidobacteraceae bacterium]